MSPDAKAAETGTAEDVELLARRLMGWERCGGFWSDNGCGDDRRYVALAKDWPAAECEARYAWNPFSDANDDVMVLERVRGYWSQEEFCAFCDAYAALVLEPDHSGVVATSVDDVLSGHTTGDFARAALAVLKEMEPAATATMEEQ